MTKLVIPELSLVTLVGVSGSGKSTFARKHFLPTEIVSSDYCRAMMSDSEQNQEATKDAFELLNFIVNKRLARGNLTVVDATNVQPDARKSIVALAKAHHVVTVAIVLNLDESVCIDRNRQRPERGPNTDFVSRQARQLKKSIGNLKREGFRYIYELNSLAEIEAAEIQRERLWTNRRGDHGPFDVIGDIHGCCDELVLLLEKLGYQFTAGTATHPEGRRALFLGDIVDRGPRIVDTIRLVMGMTKSGAALCIPGNHENKLVRALDGRKVAVNHGLEQTLGELAKETPEFQDEVKVFFDGLISHFVLDDGKLVVAHAGMREAFQGRASGEVRAFALYGETTGETDEFGLPVRYQWAADYRGKAAVIYGHTPVPTAEWFNNTLCIDTGCVYGGHLTALRWPEKELVAIPAAKVYCESRRPFAGNSSVTSISVQQQSDEILDIEDVMGKRRINTRLGGVVAIHEDNATAAVEVMSRFAVHPKWLAYLPPTMSPSETTSTPGLLEHPAEALAYYRNRGVERVVCQEKHMGSRAVVVVCKDAAAAHRRFGVQGEDCGVIYSRTGRRFLDDKKLEDEILTRVNRAMTDSGLWQELDSDWAILDCELMPWSVKAQGLLRDQYAAVGRSGRDGLAAANDLLAQGAARHPELESLQERFKQRLTSLEAYTAAYGHYCWTVNSLADIKLAPFHLLASEQGVHTNQSHIWHMERFARLAAVDQGLIVATPYKTITLSDPASEDEAIKWWESLTSNGGEGIVVKPLDFITSHKERVIQPAIKCRGPEYLRIIYGPEYMLPGNIDRLRNRSLNAKRSLAMRELYLGVEGLERFVRREPLRNVHECVFGVLALESEPVDPRL